LGSEEFKAPPVAAAAGVTRRLPESLLQLPKSWVEVNSEPPIEFAAFDPAKDGFSANITIIREPISSSTNLNTRVAALEQSLGSIEVVEMLEEDIGATASCLIFSLAVGDARLLAQHWVKRSTEGVLVLALTCALSDYGRYEEVFGIAARSWKPTDGRERASNLNP